MGDSNYIKEFNLREVTDPLMNSINTLIKTLMVTMTEWTAIVDLTLDLCKIKTKTCHQT